MKHPLAPGDLLRSLLNSWIMYDPRAHHIEVAENYFATVLYFAPLPLPYLFFYLCFNMV